MKTRSSVAQRVTRPIIAITLLALGLITIANSAQPLPAHAAAGNGITAYISPPFVQGPPASTNATIQDFNGTNFCSSLGVSNVGTFSGACTTVSSGGDFKFGGANSTSDEPTVGGTASQFVAAWNSQVLTLSFASENEARYLGFWWSAGSAGNQVKIYSKVNGNDVLTATLSTNTLNTFLNTSGAVENSVLPPNPYPGTSSVTAINGLQYNKGYYFGRPTDHSSLTPTALPLGFTNANINDNIYSHAYLNVYASGSVSFSKVEFIGGGFELDNVAVSNQVRTPSSELVLLQSVLGKSVEFRANGGTGSMPAQTSDLSTTLTQNSFTHTGHTFEGWSTSPTGTVSYLDTASYAFGADITLYAIWTLNTYTVTYEEHGGTAVADGAFTHGASLTYPAAPTRSGHTFQGWFLSSTGGTAQTETQVAAGNADVTLHAQWAAVEEPSSTVSTPSSTPVTETTQTSTTSTTALLPTTAPTTTPTTISVQNNASEIVPTVQAASNNALPKTGQRSGIALAVGAACIVLGIAALRRPRRGHINL